MKLNFNNKISGYYCSIALVALMLITAIVYSCGFSQSDSMSWWALVLLIAGIAAGIVLFLLDKMRYLPLLAFVINLLAAVCYGAGVFDYVFDAIVGIDVVGVSASFVVCTVLFGALVIFNILTLCMEQEER